MIINIIFTILFLLGFFASVGMEFTQYKYVNLTNGQRIIWRCIMMIPLFIIALNNIQHDNYNVFIAAIMLLILVSDILLIENFMAGIGAFFLVHLLIGIYFYRMFPLWSMEIFITTVILIIIGVGLWKLINSNPQIIKVLLLVYVTVMMFALSRIAVLPSVSPFILFGYIFFVLTDFEVAWMVYNGNFKGDQIINNILYYCALSGIVLSGVRG